MEEPPSFLPVTSDSIRLIEQTKTICEQRIYLDEAKELFSLISSKWLQVTNNSRFVFCFRFRSYHRQGLPWLSHFRVTCFVKLLAYSWQWKVIPKVNDSEEMTSLSGVKRKGRKWRNEIERQKDRMRNFWPTNELYFHLDIKNNLSQVYYKTVSSFFLLSRLN